jgi:hypothetical protein
VIMNVDMHCFRIRRRTHLIRPVNTTAAPLYRLLFMGHTVALTD